MAGGTHALDILLAPADFEIGTPSIVVVTGGESFLGRQVLDTAPRPARARRGGPGPGPGGSSPATSRSTHATSSTRRPRCPCSPRPRGRRSSGRPTPSSRRRGHPRRHRLGATGRPRPGDPRGQDVSRDHAAGEGGRQAGAGDRYRNPGPPGHGRLGPEVGRDEPRHQARPADRRAAARAGRGQSRAGRSGPGPPGRRHARRQPLARRFLRRRSTSLPARRASGRPGA